MVGSLMVEENQFYVSSVRKKKRKCCSMSVALKQQNVGIFILLESLYFYNVRLKKARILFSIFLSEDSFMFDSSWISKGLNDIVMIIFTSLNICCYKWN